MIMEIKYTKNGKKVAIISKVNDVQFVAQEIHIVENNEVPHGECFVVNASNLQNAYVPVSWYAKKQKEEEERYRKRTEELERELRKTNNHYRQVIHTVKQKTEWIRNLVKSFDNAMFNRAIDLLEGKIKYLVIENWKGSYEIKGFNSEVCEGTGSYDHIKLFTVFGNPDREIGIQLNRYSDGSGSSSTVIPFKDYESALFFVKDEIGKLKEYSSATLETAEKYSIPLKNDLLIKYYQDQISSYNSSIDKDEQRLDKIRLSVSEFQNKLDQLNRKGA